MSILRLLNSSAGASLASDTTWDIFLWCRTRFFGNLPISSVGAVFQA